MTKELDLYDYKILYELDNDSRKPASQIAKKVRLSKVSVNQRIKKLHDRKIIKNFMIQVNYKKLGFNTSHIFYKLRNISYQKEEELYEYLSNHTLIGYVARVDGNYDTYLVIMYKNIGQLDELLSEINRKYGQYIKERNILPVVRANYYGRKYLVKEKDKVNGSIKNSIARKEPEKIVELDETDNKILKTLSQDARLPIIELAEKLNLTKDVAHYRIKKLIKEDILQKSTINLNHEKFGNSFFKILIILNYNANEKEFLSGVSSYTNLIRSIKLSGSWDLELDFEVQNNIEMRKILKEIKEKFSTYIETAESLFIYQIDKLDYYAL